MDFNQFKQQFPQLGLLLADPVIFLAPQIPMNKILGAMSYLPPRTTPEDVLVLVDEAVFSQGKNGLCLTRDGIYFKEVFEDVNFYPMKSISSVGYSMGFLTQTLVLNGNIKMALVQPEKAGVRLLADFLNQYCVSQKMSEGDPFAHQQHLSTLPNLRPIMKLYAYLLMGWRAEWTDPVREVMVIMFDRAIVNQRDKAFLLQFMQQDQQLSLINILNEIVGIRNSLDAELRHEFLAEALELMDQRQFDPHDARYHFAEIARALVVDQDIALEIFAQYPHFAQGAHRRKQTNTPPPGNASQLSSAQQAACELLGIPPEQLDQHRLKTAYRQKIADFHPDKYQQLPEAVRQIIEQQAQQLNQARDCLMDFLK